MILNYHSDYDLFNMGSYYFRITLCSIGNCDKFCIHVFLHETIIPIALDLNIFKTSFNTNLPLFTLLTSNFRFFFNHNALPVE